MTFDPDNDVVAEFAADLRALRLEAGSPTFIKLQHDAEISRSVLSEAFGGKRLPSARTVDRIVRALDGDAAEWVRRRDAIAAAPDEEGAEPADDPVDDVEVGAPRRRRPGRLPRGRSAPPSWPSWARLSSACCCRAV